MPLSKVKADELSYLATTYIEGYIMYYVCIATNYFIPWHRFCYVGSQLLATAIVLAIANVVSLYELTILCQFFLHI